MGVQVFDLGSCNVETSRFRCNMDARKRYDWGISASTFLLTSALTRKTLGMSSAASDVHRFI